MKIKDVNDGQYSFRVILVDDLNPEDIAMVQALKARSGVTSEVVLNRIYAARREAMENALVSAWPAPSAGVLFNEAVDACMDIAAHNDACAHARRIHKDYTVGYGHKSIADCGTTTLIIEGVSMLAAKALENSPLYSGQETSTRAVDMSSVRLVDPFNDGNGIQDSCMQFYAKHWDAVAAEVRRRYPRRPGEDESKYEDAVKYRTFDVLRAWIPAGAVTDVAITMNLRQMGDHLTNLLVHPLGEVRVVATTMQGMLCERYPSSGSFGGMAGVSGVGIDDTCDVRAVWHSSMAGHVAYQLQQFQQNAYKDSLDTSELAGNKLIMAARPRGCVLPHWLSDLGQVSCGFQLDFGSFRDIQRHRNGVCRMPLLTTRLGFEMWYLEQLPEAQLEEAVELIARVERFHVSRGFSRVVERQYLVPMGFKVPVRVTYGLPAFAYVVEIRSTPQVHPTLRRAVLQGMVKPFREKHPDVLLHVDESEDPWDLRRGQQTIVAHG